MSTHKIPATWADRAKQPSFAQSVMVGATLVWLLAMLGAWLLDLGQTVMLASSLAVDRRRCEVVE